MPDRAPASASLTQDRSSPALTGAPTADHLEPRVVVGTLSLGGLGWAGTWAATHASGGVVPVLFGLLLCWLGWRAAGRPGGVGVAVLSLATTLLAGGATAALHGTAWGFSGLYSDAGFRTEAVTRFAASPSLSDYAYRGLPSYYPPLLPWVQGRVADLLGVPGWTVMKPTQLVVCFLVPLAAWVSWRRILPAHVAFWVASAVALAGAVPMKPDEWLVLTLLVPWWLEAVRGVAVAAPGRHQVVRLGAVLGLLAWCHTYFFAPLAVASVLGVGADLLRRRTVRPAPLRALVIAAVGLLVAAPTWVPMALRRLRGLPSDNLQMRWSPVGFESPPLPVPTDLVGLVMLVGAAWLVVRCRRDPLAEALALATVAAYAVVVGGQLLQALDVAVLPEKSSELCTTLLVAAGVLGVRDLLPHLARTRVPPAWAAGLGVLVLLGWGLSPWLDSHVDRPAAPAQHMRYPDGSFPAGGPLGTGSTWHPWGVATGASGPSTDDLVQAWDQVSPRPLDAGTVLLSARADLLATVPVHTFVPWKSIYSHPNGQFGSRVRLLHRLSACSTPGCAWALLRSNPYDAVDGLVLNRSPGQLYLSVTVDSFPDGWKPDRIAFDPELFTGPLFRTAELPGAVVVGVTEGGPTAHR